MTARAIILWLLLSMTGTPSLLYASENKEPGTGQPSPETVRQKLQLVKTLLVKSPALERAARSDEAMAKQQAEKAHTLYVNANDALNAGDTARAEKLLDEVLQLIENATHQTRDPLQTEREQQKNYAELLGNVRNLLATYHDLRLRMPTNVTAAPSVEPDRIPGLIDQAQALARDRHYLEAGEKLKGAHEMIISALNKLMKSGALMYDSKFKSPSEEFDYEMARYLSYEELIPIAYAELKPDESSIKLSGRYVQESREMRDRAKQQAASGELQPAIGTLLEAVRHLQAALRMVGLVLPE